MDDGDVTEADTAIIQILSWLAVKSDDATAIARTLGIDDARPCAVEQGLYESGPRRGPRVLRAQKWWERVLGVRAPVESEADARKCFIAPAVDGWTLVFGADIASDDELRTELSRAFGETQAFYSDAKHYLYLWARSCAGKTVRVVDCAGLGSDEIRSEGAAAPPEPNDLTRADEYDVLRIARAWSVDPNALLRIGAPGQIGTPRGR
jgi:hypothetical protein